MNTITENKKFNLHEDWVVVLLGFLIIGIALTGFIPAVPVYSWKDSSELSGKVLTTENAWNITIQLFYVLIIASVGSILTNRPLKVLLYVLPAIYILTVVALIVAGNKSMKNLGLEAVIFSLCIGLLIGNVFTLPQWFRSALTGELFVKIGLILLGTTVIFADILKAGSLGLIQALLV